MARWWIEESGLSIDEIRELARDIVPILYPNVPTGVG